MSTLAAEAMRARAAKLGYPFVELAAAKVPSAVLETVPAGVAQQQRLLPIAWEDTTLRVAMSEPPAPEDLERLSELLRHPIAIALAVEADLLAAIERCYATAGQRIGAVATSREEEAIDFTEVPPKEEPAEEPGEFPDPDGAAVLRAIQSIIGEALRLGASRVLMLSLRQHFTVAFRVQDDICTRTDLAERMFNPVLAKLMTMVNLSGFIKLAVSGRERKLHAIFKPTKHGLTAILDIAQDGSPIEATRIKTAKLGYPFVSLEEEQIPLEALEAVSKAIAHENGVLPLAIDGANLTVAMASPPTPELLDRLRFAVNRPLAVVLAPEGRLRASIDRHYGPAVPEVLDGSIWEASSSAEVTASPPPGERADAATRAAAEPFLAQLQTVYREKMFELFESLRSGGQVCRLESTSGDLEVIFLQAQLLPLMPATGRRYLEKKIWVLREAIVSRLEDYLEKDPLARAVAMTYSLFLAAQHLAQGQRVSVNPASSRDAWVNFVYALAIRSFPAVDSSGALLAFLTEHLDQLASRVAALTADPRLVHNPATSRGWLARMEGQTVTDEALDYDSSPILHLLELLIAEAVHVRASAIAILPVEDHVEVAYRIQNAIYARQWLPLKRLYPLLARLRMLTEFAGELNVAVGTRERVLKIEFQSMEHGVAAHLRIQPDTEAAEACRTQAILSNLPFAQLANAKIPAALLRLIPKAVAWRKAMLPLGVQDGVLVVALSKPPDARRMAEVRLIFNRPVSVALAPEDDILAAIHRHYHPPETSASPFATALLGGTNE